MYTKLGWIQFEIWKEKESNALINGNFSKNSFCFIQQLYLYMGCVIIHTYTLHACKKYMSTSVVLHVYVFVCLCVYVILCCRIVKLGLRLFVFYNHIWLIHTCHIHAKQLTIATIAKSLSIIVPHLSHTHNICKNSKF